MAQVFEFCRDCDPRLGRQLAERSMGSVVVVVLDVLADYEFEMTSADDPHAVEALTTDRADEAFCEGVGPGCPDRGPDDPHANGAEHLVEAGRELGVPIPDQEPDGTPPI